MVGDNNFINPLYTTVINCIKAGLKLKGDFHVKNTIKIEKV